MSRAGLHPSVHYRGLRFARTAGEAFRTPEWAEGFEPHVRFPMWKRLALFLRRNFA